MVWEQIWAGAIVALLTWFEVWKRFGVVKRLDFWLLNLGFAGFNSLLALFLYQLLLETGALEGLKNVSPSLRSIVGAMGYLTLVRTKVITLRLKNQEIPLGIEALYESGQEFFYNQINQIVSRVKDEAIQGLIDESIRKCNNDKQLALGEMAKMARRKILTDSLLGNQDKRELKAWMTSILRDEVNSTDKNKLEIKLEIIANFILFKIT